MCVGGGYNIANLFIKKNNFKYGFLASHVLIVQWIQN